MYFSNTDEKEMKLILVFAIILFVSISTHAQPMIVPEGHVGVAYRFGSLQNHTLDPGAHLSVPLFQTITSVQVNQQTDVVADIKCGTKSGVAVTFREIFVVNMLSRSHVIAMVRNYSVDYDKELIFKRVEHELCQFCSRHTLDEVYITMFSDIDEYLQESLQAYINAHSGGLTIISVRITKPSIPESIGREYDRIATQETIRRVEEKELVNTAERLRSEQAREKMTLQHQHEQQLMQLEAQLVETEKKREIAEAESEILKLKADQEFYAAARKNEAVLQLAASNGFVNMEIARAVSANQKVYYGEKIPTTWWSPAAVGTPLAV